MLKKIGDGERVELEQLLQMKVFLKLFVKTKKNWREDIGLVNQFGYKPES